MSIKKTTEDFILEATKLHDGKYNYNKTVYCGAKEKVIITCPIHGDFSQYPTNHLRPCGCPGCTGEAIRKGRGFGVDGNFDIAAAKLRHGDKYDYSAVVFGGNKVKVSIGCPEHGVFLQTPEKHLAGNGCPQCAVERLADERRLTTEQFIKLATVKHDGKYTYEKSEYTGGRDVLTVTCPEHGDFEQKASNHLAGKGCKKCADIRTGASQFVGKDGFVTHARSVHGDKYNYDKVEYISAMETVIITCPEHGDFKQRPNNHTQGQCCPKCSATFGPSRAETELFEFIKALAPDAVQSDRTILGGKELDILVPSKQLAFEFNGLYWHSEATGTPLRYHQDKSDQASKAGVRLIHIFEDEWRDKRAWCESHIRNVLNAPARTIYARKCEIELCDNASAVRDFLNDNHLQGFRGGRSIILRHQGEIVAAAVLAKTIQGEIELARWCVKLNTRIVGGMARVMAHIPEGVISYCDSGKYDGAGYLAAGWKKVSEGVPSYHYTDFRSRRGRQEFQKHKLLARGAVGENEIELAASEGFYRIGGLRQMKFVK